MMLTPVLVLFASSMRIVSGAGPEVWRAISEQCNGMAQSPVNIVTKKMLPDERLTPFDLIGYQDTFHGLLMNNGHTVQLDLPFGIKVKGGNLGVPYKALQLHLHWGKDGRSGSEHMIDGEQFPMEAEVSLSANKKFDPLINALKDITLPRNSTTLKGVSLEMLIPPQKNMTKYFRYDGSLTTPDCAESVVWTLFENTIPLSRTQLTAFYQLQFLNGEQMVNTYRPLQPLNRRQVYYSGGHVAVVSAALLIVSMLVSSALCLHATG
ncbi:hypothetical protein L3Q82_004921 [Scortum barcoo]|uniref:Uncharacterized protein n=1 Tax=Scortum barcoo TaxID=214431 RepID=A0ACB8VDZ1_9TELE|nr:hypothetical protein L3Q82_004921 [Scortum barcoo]